MGKTHGYNHHSGKTMVDVMLLLFTVLDFVSTTAKGWIPTPLLLQLCQLSGSIKL